MNIWTKKNIFVGKNNDSIKEAIKRIKLNGTRTLIITNKEKKLLGTLTEGDIQKALINDVKLDNKILQIYNKKPKKILYQNLDNTDLKKFFIDGQYGLVPIVNENNKIINILTWKDIFINKKSNVLENLDIIIMAGGKGKRLKPITEILPKPLVPIDGRPMLEHIIENFKYFRFKKFNLIINHQANLILSYFRSSKKYKIKFIKEKKPLGTAGGISLVKHNLSQNVVLTNCDTLYKIDYLKLYNFHLKNNNDITLTVSDKKFEFPYGSCDVTSGKLFSLKEKPKINFIANVGLYLIKKEIIKLIVKNEQIDMTDLINRCLKLKKKIGAFKIKERDWVDLGKLSNLGINNLNKI